MVPPPHHPHGPPLTFGAHDGNGGGAASGVGPSSTEGAHDDEQPRAKPPLPSSQGVEHGGDKRPGDHLDPAPDHLGHAPSEKPNPGPAPNTFAGAGVGTAAGHRPPHSEGVHYQQGTGWAPKPEQLVPNEAPTYRHQQQPYQQQPYPPYQPAPGQFPPVQYQQPPYPGYGSIPLQPVSGLDNSMHLSTSVYLCSYKHPSLILNWLLEACVLLVEFLAVPGRQQTFYVCRLPSVFQCKVAR